MAAIRGRGPQVMLEGYARTVARGAAGRTMRDNIAAMDALVSAGLAPDGNTVDGSSRNGGTPYDTVVAQFPRETLSAWAVPAPLLDIMDGGAPVSVLEYGADPTGVADSTAAFRAALATHQSVYAPSGTYHITGQLVIGPNQSLFGDSRSSTILTIGPDFSPTDSGVISLAGAEFGSGIVRDLQMVFSQPTTIASRASMRTLAGGGTLTTGIMYPPAIILAAANRFRITNVAVSGAWDGIIHAVGTGNIGGFIIENVEMGALNCGLLIDNVLDFGHIKGYHFWCFGLNLGTTYSNVFIDGNTFGAKFGVNGQANGITLTDFTVFQGRVSVATIGTWIHATNMMMDGNNATLEVASCQWLLLSNIYFSGQASGANANAQLSVAGGIVMAQNLFTTTTLLPNISVTGGRLLLSNSYVAQGTPTVSAITSTGGGILEISDCIFSSSASPQTVPLVNIASGTVSFHNNRFDRVSPGDVGGLVIAADNAVHSVVGNYWNGWGWAPPGNLGDYGFNSDMTTSKRLILAGSANIGTPTGPSCSLSLLSGPGAQRAVSAFTGSLQRWALLFSNDPESGGNTGTNLILERFDDTGAVIDQTMTVTRADGITFIRQLHSSSFYLGNNAPIGRQTVAGAWAGNTAGKALCVALAAFGLITDNTTA